MGPFRWFLFVYVLGGITFVPLVVALLVAFVYYTSPLASDPSSTKNDDPADLSRENDEKLIFKSGTDDLAEKFHRRHDSDVAAGYFAVCREFVPGGVNGKPPDKLSPAGEVVANESPSVYQTMYRSIFDRSQKATLDSGKDGAGRTARRPNNVFYVVLRHGHLMLYDDIQQLEVRYVISLDYHDVDVCSGEEEEPPEGELWVKRNAIRLKRKQTQVGDKGTSLPFYLFGENLSGKEDFYHAILKNQQKNSEDIPEYEDFDVKYIVALVQKLHSSEEQLQTRWLNAMIGRVFLAIYKTSEVEDFIRSKLMKKMSRVKKPTFITKLSLLKLDTGTAGPFITNPRLKDLTVNGDCMIEADVEYTGNFRLEVGATARIDLGKRFGAREVEMVLAVTVKKVQGHALARIKPPPSNRIWFSFEKMPQLDLAVEPIVSTRQITYTVILRAIESRIREVVAESLVFPNWDDVPFLRTEGQKFRGGIWKREKAGSTPVEIKEEVPESEAEAGGSGTKTPDTFEMMRKEERNMSTLSMPLMTETRRPPSSHKTVASMNDYLGATGDKIAPARPPRVLRTSSFASAVDPKLTANHVDTDTGKQEGDSTTKRESAAAILKDLSSRSSGGTPPGSTAGSPPAEGSLASAMKDRSASITSKGSRESINGSSRLLTNDLSATPTGSQGSRPTTPSGSANNSRPPSYHEEDKPKSLAQQAKSMTNQEQRKQAIASASAAAQKWSSIGWGVLNKRKQGQSQGPGPAVEQDRRSPTLNGRPSAPMGRGQPLPPPGVPLPKPQKPTMMSSFGSMVPKRKPVLPKRPEESEATDSAAAAATETTPPNRSSKAPPPPLPSRRQRQRSRAESIEDDDDVDDVLVVEAPMESAPTSPAAQKENRNLDDDFFGHGEDDDNDRRRNDGEEEEPGSQARESTSDTERQKPVQAEEPITAIQTKQPQLSRAFDEGAVPPSQDDDSLVDGYRTGRETANPDTLKDFEPPPPELTPRSPTSPSVSTSQAQSPAVRMGSIKRKPLNRSASSASGAGISTSTVGVALNLSESGGGLLPSDGDVDAEDEREEDQDPPRFPDRGIVEAGDFEREPILDRTTMHRTHTHNQKFAGFKETEPNTEIGNVSSKSSGKESSREQDQQRSLSPHQSEAVNAERTLGMMEGASWGGGYNE